MVDILTCVLFFIKNEITYDFSIKKYQCFVGVLILEELNILGSALTK